MLSFKFLHKYTKQGIFSYPIAVIDEKIILWCRVLSVPRRKRSFRHLVSTKHTHQSCDQMLAERL